MTSVSPYGTWPSPISAELLVKEAVGLGQVTTDGEFVYWNELRPSEGGRNVVMRRQSHGGAEPEALLPPEYSARTLVHEMGGRCYIAAGDDLYFSNFVDQRLYHRHGDGSVTPLTPEPGVSRGVRWGEPLLTTDGSHLICVRERHGAAGTGAKAVVNDLVAVATDGSGEVSVLFEGHDFFAAPRLAPDGRRLAVLCWDHPNMPWDATTLLVASLTGDLRLGAVEVIAGGPDVSVSQPRFSPAGVLHYLSDESGYWNLYDEHHNRLCPLDAEFGGPDWVLGETSYAFAGDRLVAIASLPGGQQLGTVDSGAFSPIALDASVLSSLSTTPSRLALLCGSPRRPLAVASVGLDGYLTVLRSSQQLDIEATYLAAPQAIEFPTSEGDVAHALFYPPTNPDSVAPDGELPPLIVQSHGGPTGAARSLLDLRIQFWTSRGFALVDVDYRGSTGYGRAFRDRLAGKWGIYDVDDCVAAAEFLVETGRADAARLAIHGGSAGGFTTLCALTFRDVFVAGASYAGVSDLESLAAETHKFESRYLDKLVGPYPEAIGVYRERSPLEHAAQLRCPVIFFHGLEDAIVPPNQAEEMYQLIAGQGIPTAYLGYPGEQHGFRRAETIVSVAESELYFYGRVFGFTPGDDLTPVEIANDAALTG